MWYRTSVTVSKCTIAQPAIITQQRVNHCCTCTLTLRPRSWLSPSLSVISAADMAFGKSCLFANTSSTASLSSSSWSCIKTAQVKKRHCTCMWDLSYYQWAPPRQMASSCLGQLWLNTGNKRHWPQFSLHLSCIIDMHTVMVFFIQSLTSSIHHLSLPFALLT